MRNIGGRITPGLLEQLGLLGESVRLRERFLEAAASFTSSYSNTLIAASLASSAILPWCYFQIQEAELKRKAVTDPAQPLPSMLLCCGRFPLCRESGSFPASSMTWRPDWLILSYRQRGFVLRKISIQRTKINPRPPGVAKVRSVVIALP
jgi:hypothetical protein